MQTYVYFFRKYCDWCLNNNITTNPNPFNNFTKNVIEELLDKNKDELQAATVDYTNMLNMVKKYFSLNNLSYILNYQYNDNWKTKINEILEDGTNADTYKAQLIAGTL